MLQLVEQRLLAWRADSVGGDRLVVADNIIGVVDSSTPKPWDPPEPSVETIADAVACVLGEVTPRDDLATTVGRLTDAIADLKRDAGILPHQGGCATFAVVQGPRRELWRCGDPTMLVDGRMLRNNNCDGEAVVAQARALATMAAIGSGASVAELQETDRGRRQVLALLRSLLQLRNKAIRFGYGAVDGNRVPDELLERVDLPQGEVEIVLATDGYPDVRRTLKESEQALLARLKRDPLLVAEPPQTKGWRPGAASYDDRAYVRVRLTSSQR